MRAGTLCAQMGCPALAVRRGRCIRHQRAIGRQWERLRVIVRKRARGRCERCGTRTTQLHVHHVEDVALGGAELPDASLLKALCLACHRAEHRSRAA